MSNVAIQWVPRKAKAIRDGLSAASLVQLAEFLELPQARVADLIGVSSRTLGRRLEEGHFSQDESDRLARLIRIVRLAFHAFDENDEAAVSWLKSPHPLLDDEAPIEHADTDVGARAVEDILNALRYGFAA